jgi:hypothetical protein
VAQRGERFGRQCSRQQQHHHHHHHHTCSVGASAPHLRRNPSSPQLSLRVRRLSHRVCARRPRAELRV